MVQKIGQVTEAVAARAPIGIDPALTVPPGLIIKGENVRVHDSKVINGSIEATESAKNLRMDNVTVNNEEWLEYLTRMATQKKSVLGEISKRREAVKAGCTGDINKCHLDEVWLDDIEKRLKAAEGDFDETAKLLREFKDAASSRQP